MIQVPELAPELGAMIDVDNTRLNHRGDGLAVASVIDGKAAAQLGIKAGDVLLRLNGHAIDNLNLFVRVVTIATSPGEAIAVDLLRDGRAMTLNGVMGGGRALTVDEIPLPFARFRDSDPLRLAFYSGADPTGYEADHDPAEPGSLRYRAVAATPKAMGTWMTFGPRLHRLQQLIGKRVRFSADVRTADVAKGCGLHIYTIGFAGDTDCWVMVNFDDMSTRSITGTTPWRRQAVVVDLPVGTYSIAMGVSLDGPGTMWVRDVVFEEVDATVATTSIQQVCVYANAQYKKHWDDVQRKKAKPSEPAVTPKDAF